MHKKIFLGIVLIIAENTYSQNWQWAKTTNVSHVSYNGSTAITFDNQNNYYTTGRNGINSVEKINSVGANIWSIPSIGNFEDIVYDNGSYLYATGSYGANNFLFSKMDTSGAIAWIKPHYRKCNGKGLKTDKDNNIYLVGNYLDSVSFDGITIFQPNLGSHRYFFIAKFDSSGNCLFLKHGGQAYANDLDIDSLGNCYITGYFYQNSVIGNDTLSSRGTVDVFVSKFDSTGNALWVKQAGGKHSGSYSKDEGYAIACSKSGNVYVTGSCTDTAQFESVVFNNSNANNDIFVAKYSSFGNLIWVKRFGSVIDDEGRSIAVDEYENIYVGGSHVGTVNIGTYILPAFTHYDLFVAKFDSAGIVIWAKNAGGYTWNEYAKGIIIDKNNDVVICGEFSSPAYFGNDTIYYSNSSNSFIAKLSNPLTAINEISGEMNFNLYPNPASSTIAVESSKYQVQSIRIMDVLGREIYYLQTTNDKTEIDVSELPSGIYILQVQSKSGVVSKKFVKE
jgi:hypothetical protein